MQILILLVSLLSLNNFFDMTLSAKDGSTIQLSAFKGKKILLVNIASESKGISQIKNMEALHQRYKDDLVIIAIPSNSFGKEPLSGKQLDNLFTEQYSVHFLVTARSEIVGSNALTVYKWLASKSENGIAAVPIVENFQKVLISGEGKIVGIFSGSEDPMSENIQKAIVATY